MGNGIPYDSSVFTSAIDTLIYLDLSFGAGSATGIFDLTGIEDFSALTYLDCSYNQITSLDVSSNIALTYLDCQNNWLTNLNVSQNTALTYLDCWDNDLTFLDVSNNTSLDTLDCGTNQLSSLDVSQNPSLIFLRCFINQITSLDVSHNLLLNVLRCSANQLTVLDVSQNTALTWLACDGNGLSSLNLNQNIYLDEITCYHNQLTTLDLSQNTALTYLRCYNNQLTSLDLRNGNNINVIDFNTINNPSLTCINVDDPTWSIANWTVANGNIDPQSSFSLNCIVPGCTDSLACNYDALATVDDSSCTYLDIIAVPTSVTCFGMFDGSIVATAAGGTFPLQYSLGAGLSQTSGTFSNLSAGTYYIDVTDANGCTSNQMVIITEPAALSISVDSTNETSALNDGTATAVINGGTAPYIYTWNNGIPSVSAQTTNLQVNLAPGLYTIVVTDANGCVISDSTSVNAYSLTSVINIKNPSKTLIKVTDMLGQETPSRRNAPLFYIYDDGTVEKQIIIE